MSVDDFTRLLKEPLPIDVIDEAVVKDAKSFVNPQANIRFFVRNLLLSDIDRQIEGRKIKRERKREREC